MGSFTFIEVWDIVMTIITVGLAIGVPVYMYHKRNHDTVQKEQNEVVRETVKALTDKLADIEKTQSAHDYKFVTRQDVKEIINEALTPLKSDFVESRTLTQEMYAIVNKIGRDMAVMKAMRERDLERKE